MKTIKNRKMLYGILSLMLVVVMTFATSTSVFAASGSKKVTASGKMSVALNVGQTGDSSSVSINVSGLPSNAVITKLEVNTGTLTFQGAANTTLKTNNFLASSANGTYTLSFNSTCVGGAIVGGNILKIGTKTYSKPYITVYWDDTL